MARGLETLFAVFMLGAAVAPGAADPLLRDFSTCAGRLSALVEHQWLVDGPASDVSANRRDAMLELVAAVMPPEMARTAMGWRIEAKVAQRALLDRAYFAQDAAAEKRSAQLLQGCAT
ncbi:MAG: hypothetical protein HC783_02220 [Rhodobacteraceae bacterium]|nr:hypothetical protein [Paracoccaceae bacterium]